MASKGFVFDEKKGDLFQLSGAGDCLAHCVSTDLRMGKGIATIFKSRFGGINELRNQKVLVGGVAVLKREGRFIYYLVTKEKYYDKPTYETLKSSLTAMRDHCTGHNIKTLAIPRLGCGLDRLDWSVVRKDIADIFQDTDIAITACSLD